MRKIFTIVLLLISLSLSASHVHLSLTGVTSGSYFYYCTTIDSIIVYKPVGTGTAYWFPGGNPPSQLGDSLIITQTSQLFWEFTDLTVSVLFYINFTAIAPTEPWTVTDTTKCTESSIILKGQATNQPDFTYAWNTGSTAWQINATNPGIYYVTVTGACGTVNNQIEVLNYPVPVPNLGADVVTCNGNTITLDPGAFTGYAWSTSVSTPTIDVTSDGTYRVTVTDVNGCHGSDTIDVSFIINDGEEILLMTIDTLTGNNKVTWETLGTTDVTTVIYREVSTNIYDSIGSGSYADGEWTDNVNSMNQTWRYKISTIDTCGNESPQSFYHQTISTATVPLVPSGYRVEWTEYLVEGSKGDNKSVSNYYVFAVEGLGLNWSPTQIAAVSGSVTSYNLPSITDSMFVVGAEIGAKSLTNGLALSNVVDNPLINSVPSLVAASHMPIYPNPSTGNFTVSGEGVMSIYNVIGECVSTETIYGITTVHLNSGIYMVKITDKQNATLTQKVIVH